MIRRLPVAQLQLIEQRFALVSELHPRTSHQHGPAAGGRRRPAAASVARIGEGHDKGVESRGKGIRLQHMTPVPRGESSMPSPRC